MEEDDPENIVSTKVPCGNKKNISRQLNGAQKQNITKPVSWNNHYLIQWFISLDA